MARRVPGCTGARQAATEQWEPAEYGGENPWRWCEVANDEREGRANRDCRSQTSVDVRETVEVFQRPRGCDDRHDAQGHSGTDEPCRRSGRIRVVGMLDQADHARASRRDGKRYGQVNQRPTHDGAARRTGQPPADEVEIDPPEAEANPQGNRSGADGDRVALGVRQAVDDAEHDLAEHDDREQPEAFCHRVSRNHAASECLRESENSEEPDEEDGIGRPNEEPGVCHQKGAAKDRDGGGEHYQHVPAGECHELCRVLPADRLP